jgi:hypothetical protein
MIKVFHSYAFSATKQFFYEKSLEMNSKVRNVKISFWMFHVCWKYEWELKKGKSKNMKKEKVLHKNMLGKDEECYQMENYIKIFCWKIYLNIAILDVSNANVDEILKKRRKILLCFQVKIGRNWRGKLR